MNWSVRMSNTGSSFSSSQKRASASVTIAWYCSTLSPGKKPSVCIDSARERVQARVYLSVQGFGTSAPLRVLPVGFDFFAEKSSLAPKVRRAGWARRANGAEASAHWQRARPKFGFSERARAPQPGALRPIDRRPIEAIAIRTRFKDFRRPCARARAGAFTPKLTYLSAGRMFAVLDAVPSTQTALLGCFSRQFAKLRSPSGPNIFIAGCRIKTRLIVTSGHSGDEGLRFSISFFAHCLDLRGSLVLSPCRILTCQTHSSAFPIGER